MRKFILMFTLMLAVVASPAGASQQPLTMYDEWEDEEALTLIDVNSAYCAILLSHLAGPRSGASYIRSTGKDYRSRMEVCQHIAYSAEELDLDVPFALSIAWVESGFNSSVVSHAGAVGAMQILPKYHCPGGRLSSRCNVILSGLRVIGRLTSKYPLSEAACHYNAGNKCGKQAWAYSRRVMAARERLLVYLSWLIVYSTEE